MELLERICMAPVNRRQPDPRRVVAKGITKRVWMLLLTEGGWWTAAEIVERLHVHSPHMRQMLREMMTGGQVRKRNHITIDGEARTEFGVTKECKPPREVTLDDIWRVLQATAASVP